MSLERSLLDLKRVLYVLLGGAQKHDPCPGHWGRAPKIADINSRGELVMQRILRS
jgi:hypothetical protein